MSGWNEILLDRLSITPVLCAYRPVMIVIRDGQHSGSEIEKLG